MTLNASLNIAKMAIQNNEFALNVISNNVANMNTPGYCRQSVAFQSRAGYETYNYASSRSFNIGDGAEIAGIIRNRDQFLDNSYRSQSADTGFYTQIGSMTSIIESTMNELGEKGLQSVLNQFFEAAEALAGDPSNKGYRIAYASALQSVADKFNQMSSSLQTAIKENVGEVGDAASFAGSKVKTTVDDLNSKLAQLADLNQQVIRNTGVNGSANEILDKRDTLLDEISAIIPITTTTNSNNTINVSFEGLTLVDGNQQKLQFNAIQGTTEDKPAIIQITSMEDPPKFRRDDMTAEASKSGTLGAILSSAGSTTDDGVNYSTVLAQLDQLAAAFAEKLNEIQTGVNGTSTPMYINADGQLEDSTTPLFVTKDGSADFTAGNISFNQDIMNDTNLIAAARVTKELPDGAYDPENIGNGLNMDLVLDLKTEKLDSLAATPGGAPASLTEFLTNTVSSVGNTLSNIDNKAATQQDVLSQIDNQRVSLYGVNLNEEVTDLIKYQRAYEAAARVFNVTNQMMQILTSLGA